MAETIRIDVASPVPAYRQIANGIRALLVAGVPGPGSQLATVRRLATDLGVHHNTVAEAYRMLAKEGWLELARRRGATVRRPPSRRASEEDCGEYLRRLRELVAEARAAGVPARPLRGALTTLANELRRRRGSA